VSFVLFKVKNHVKSNIESGVKSGLSKADPFSRGINKSDVSDSGAESIRFARQAGDKFKTTSRTVKKSNRAIKKAGRVTIRTARATYDTAAYAAKNVKTVVQFTVKAAIHLVAAAFNPLTWIAAGLLLSVILVSQTVAVLGGGGGGKRSAAAATSGLGNITTAHAQGMQFYNAAVTNRNTVFTTLVNLPAYRRRDLPSSDLIYWHFRRDREITQVSPMPDGVFATDEIRAFLISEGALLISANDVLAISYVFLQKEINRTIGTTGQIHDVVFTQEAVNRVIELAADLSFLTDTGYYCPMEECAVNDDGERYCGGHRIFEIFLDLRTKEAIMHHLDFTEAEKQMVEQTLISFSVHNL
jgi:hypothetical protein